MHTLTSTIFLSAFYTFWISFDVKDIWSRNFSFLSSTSITIITRRTALVSRRVKIMSFSHFTSCQMGWWQRGDGVCRKKPLKQRKKENKKEENFFSRRKSEVENSSTTATTNALYEPLDSLECSFEIEIFLSLSLSHLPAHSLDISPSQRSTRKKFPLRVCVLLLRAASCRYCRAVCGSELAILFVSCVPCGRSTQVFFIYCDCFTSLANNRDGKRQREQNGWTSAAKQWEFLPFSSASFPCVPLFNFE